MDRVIGFCAHALPLLPDMTVLWPLQQCQQGLDCFPLCSLVDDTGTRCCRCTGSCSSVSFCVRDVFGENNSWIGADMLHCDTEVH